MFPCRLYCKKKNTSQQLTFLLVIFFTDHPSDYGGQRCGCHGKDWQWENCGLPGADAGAAKGALFQGCTCTHLVPDQGAGTADLKIYKRGWLCFIVLKTKQKQKNL